MKHRRKGLTHLLVSWYPFNTDSLQIILIDVEGIVGDLSTINKG